MRRKPHGGEVLSEDKEWSPDGTEVSGGAGIAWEGNRKGVSGSQGAWRLVSFCVFSVRVGEGVVRFPNPGVASGAGPHPVP